MNITVKDMGLLAQKAYETVQQNSTFILNDKEYKVLQTQDTITATSDNNAGFQAMLLQNTQTGDYIIAFRGTEFSLNPFQISETWKDGVSTDIAMAIGDDLVAQMELALMFIDDLSDDYSFNRNNTAFTGHSLGGSLASIAGYTYGFDTYTYNGFGVKDILEGSDYTEFLNIYDIESLHDDDSITNILHVGGEYVDIITGAATNVFGQGHVGELLMVKDHTGGYLDIMGNHFIAPLNESIAVYNNLLSLFPEEDYNSLSSILGHVAPGVRQVSCLLESLSELTGTSVNHTNHVTWSENIRNSGAWNFEIEGFGEDFPVNLESLARNNEKYLYALIRLTPFTITGADYSFLDNDSYSDQYLEDRTAFLFQLTYPETPSPTNDDIQFKDKTLGIEAYAGNGTPDLSDRKYIFGTSGSDTYGVAINSKDDHLYGMDDNDWLFGHGGNDHLEGGDDNDTLSGGSDENWLYGGEGRDIYIVGKGIDHITDPDKNGIIKDYNGNILNGKWEKTGDGQYEHKRTGLQATMNSPFTIALDNGFNVIIDEFSDGDFSIRLIDEPLQIPDLDIDGISVHGDLARKVFYDGDGNPYYKKDTWGNWITTSASAPGTNDYLFGSYNNDHLIGLSGDDRLSDSRRGGDDRFEGGGGDDHLQDGEGNSLLVGGSGSDTQLGGADNDRLYGDEIINDEEAYELGESEEGTGERGDFLAGGDGDDRLYGWNSNDLLDGGIGADIIYGGAGDDDIFGDLGFNEGYTSWRVTRLEEEVDDSTYYGSLVEDAWTPWDIYLLQPGDDEIYGGSGEDWIYSGGGNDFVEAGSDDDVVFGEAGSDVILGDSGDDFLSGDDPTLSDNEMGDDLVEGGSGNDILWGYGRDDILLGGDGDDILVGDSTELTNTDGIDFLDGGAGDDELQGGDKDDVLIGGDGDDRLHGDIGDNTGNGHDLLYGDSGEDELIGGDGDDTLYGGEDNDKLWGDHGTGSNNGTGNDTLHGGSGEDQLVGGDGDDILYGGADDDTLMGDNGDQTGTGTDILYGGDGDDKIEGSGGDDFLSGDQGNDKLWGDNADQTGSGADTLYGGEGDDELQGSGGDDLLYGDEGDDILYGDHGDFSGTGNDQLYGGEGNDQLSGGNGDDTVVGNEGDDLLFGDNGDHTGGGQDELDGGDGNDIINGGGNDDILHGGIGNDILYGDHGNLTGTGNDSLFGGDGDDQLTGGNGNDTLSGGAGDDDLFGDNTNQSGSGNDQLSGGAGNDDLMGGNGDDILQGDGGNDYLWGGNGNDILSGGEGNDVLRGEEGDDRFVLTAGGGTDFVVDDQGHTTIQFENVADIFEISAHYAIASEYRTTKNSYGDDLWLEYSEGDIVVIIDGRQNESYSFVFENGVSYNHSDLIQQIAETEQESPEDREGNSGGGNLSDLINTITWNSTDEDDDSSSDNSSVNDHRLVSAEMVIRDILRGKNVFGHADGNFAGIQVDPYWFIQSTPEEREESQLSTISGINTSRFGLTRRGGAGNDQINGGPRNDSLAGREGDDQIYGFDGDDYLDGGTGVDILYGGDGNDSMISFDGNDIMYGGAGNDIMNGETSRFRDTLLIGGPGSDLMVYGTVDYTDSPSGVLIDFNTGEARNGDATGDQYEDIAGVIGSQFDDNIHGFSWCANTIEGGIGDDHLYCYGQDDRLIAGNGRDRLFGGGGNDTYEIGAEYITKSHDEHTPLSEINLSQDTISDSSGDDTVLFVKNAVRDEIVFSYVGSSLFVFYGSELQYSVEIENNSIEVFQTSSGETITRDKVLETLQQIASLKSKSVSSLGPQEIFNDTELMAIQYNSWKDQDSANGESTIGYNSNGKSSGGNNSEYDDDSNDLSDSEADLYGTENDDTLVGNDSENRIFAKDGDDRVHGEGGDDELQGGNGNDMLDGGEGDDKLYGNSGNDHLNAEDGNDILEGGYGSNTLAGGDGDDIYLLSAEIEAGLYDNDFLSEDLLYDDDGQDKVIFENITDWEDVSFYLRNNVLHVFYGSGLQHSLVIEENAVEVFELQNGTIKSREEIVQLLTDDGREDGYDHEPGSYDDDTGGYGNIISGTDGDDILKGNDSDDHLNAEDGNDKLDGGYGSNVLAGGRGNDHYYLSAENESGLYDDDLIADDYLYDDDGNDSVIFSRDIVWKNILFELEDEDLHVRYGEELQHYLIVAENSVETFKIEGGDTKSREEIIQSLTVDGGEDGYDDDPGSYDDDFMSGDSSENVSADDNGELVGDSNYGDGATTDNNDEIEEPETIYDNSIKGGKKNDVLKGGSGNDYITGKKGDDTLTGGKGNDQLIGGPGNDMLKGNSGNDILKGNDGDDRLFGGKEDDLLKGGSGDDNLNGGKGNDNLKGGSGNDFLEGNNGDDELDGGSGDDFLSGGKGNDLLNGKGGYNELNGGKGDDIYLLTATKNDGLNNSELIADDYISDSSGIDRVVFDSNVKWKNILFILSENDDLVVRYGSSFQHSIFIEDNSIELFHLRNGNTKSREEIIQSLTNHDGEEGYDDDGYDDDDGGDSLPLGAANYVRSLDEDSDIDGQIEVENGGDETEFSIWQEATSGEFEIEDDGSWYYTPNENFNGNDQAKVKITNAIGEGVISTIDFTINPINDFPVVDPIEPYHLKSKRTVDGQLLVNDVDGDELSFSLIGEPPRGNLSLEQNGSWKYEATEGFIGNDSITVLVEDGHGGQQSVDLHFNVQVSPPMVKKENVTLDEDTAVEGRLTVDNPVGGSLTFLIDDESEYGVFQIDEEGRYTYIPSADFYGEDRVNLTVRNEYGMPAEATVSLTVLPVNDLPQVEAPPKNLLQDVRVSAGKLEASDVDGDLLRFSSIGEQPAGTLSFKENGSWEYKAAAGFIGNDAATVLIEDGKGGSRTVQLQFEVIVSKPSLKEDELSLDEDERLEGKLDVNNPVGGALTYSIDQNGESGSFQIDEDGKFSYVPKDNFFGTDTVLLTIANTYGLSTQETLVLTVLPVNDKPGAPEEVRTVLEDIFLETGVLSATDVDGDELSYSISVGPENGSLTIDENGNWRYEVGEEYTGDESAEIIIKDGNGGTTTTTLTFSNVRSAKSQGETQHDQVSIEKTSTDSSVTVKPVQQVVSVNTTVEKKQSTTKKNTLSSTRTSTSTSFLKEFLEKNSTQQRILELTPEGGFPNQWRGNKKGLDLLRDIPVNSRHPENQSAKTNTDNKAANRLVMSMAENHYDNYRQRTDAIRLQADLSVQSSLVGFSGTSAGYKSEIKNLFIAA